MTADILQRNKERTDKWIDLDVRSLLGTFVHPSIAAPKRGEAARLGDIDIHFRSVVAIKRSRALRTRNEHGTPQTSQRGQDLFVRVRSPRISGNPNLFSEQSWILLPILRLLTRLDPWPRFKKALEIQSQPP
jgi:hypothetical protein